MTILSAENMYSKESTANTFIQQVYGWMAFALAISASVSYYISTSPALIQSVLGSFYLLIILELVVVVILSFLVQKIHPLVAGILFIGYAALNGFTFSVFFLVFQLSSMVSIFGVTA